MKIRLVDKTVHAASRVEIVDGRLEVDFLEKSAEEIDALCSVPANWEEIELLTDAGETFSDGVRGWTVYAGTLLLGGVTTAIFTKAPNVTEERLTAAEADALAAKTETTEQAQAIAELKKQVAEGGAGVDQELFAATAVVARANAQALTDEQALGAKVLYHTFDELVEMEYTAEKEGYKFRDGADLWKTAQDNITFQAQYRPGSGTESLYTHIDEAHAGTLEDPIPAKANMEYEYGKYYVEGGTIYLCRRGGIPDDQAEEMYGQKETLQYLPSALVGQYFVAVEG